MAVLTRGLSELFEEFLRGFEDKDGDRKYQVVLAQLAASGRKSVIVDYEDLIHYNTDLAESLLKDPDKALRECKSAAFEVLSTENPSYAGEIRQSLTVRLRGVTDRVPLRKVDTSHLDKMIAFAGMVIRTSELRPLLVDAAFVCPDGHTTRVIQEGPSIKKPAKCEGCDETRNLELDQKDSAFIDSQILRVQELPEELPPGQLPRFFDIDVEGDIVNTARPGDRAIMTGIVRAEQDFTLGQPRSRSFRSKIDANYIEVVGKEPSQVHISKEDEAIIKSIASGPDAYQKLIRSMAPGILGHEAVKEAMLLLLVGGPQTVLPDGTKLRGDINVFLVGDPGVAKSEMLKFAAQVAPRGMFASGRGSTAAGLSAAVIREKNTLMLEAGVVVLADQGIACIDEFDKMKPEDRSALHEQMEQQTVTIAKGGIYATLNARTAILAATNPILGKYNPYQNLIDNITLPIPLLSVGPDEQILIRQGQEIRSVRIGKFVDAFYSPNEEGYPMFVEAAGIEVASMDEHFRIRWQPLKYVFRHKSQADTFKVSFKGRDLVLTRGHCVYTFGHGGLVIKPTEQLRKGDYVALSRRLPAQGHYNEKITILDHISTTDVLLHNVPESALQRISGIPSHRKRRRMMAAIRYRELTQEELRQTTLSLKGSGFHVPSEVPLDASLLRLIGYFVAEGSMVSMPTEGVYAVDFSLPRKNDRKVLSDIVSISKKLFNVEPTITFHGNGLKVGIRSRLVVEFLSNHFGLASGAPNKRVPDIVFNVPVELKWEFLNSYYAGDAGATTSKELASQLLQLFSQLGHVASVFHSPAAEKTIQGHAAKGKESYLVPFPAVGPASNDIRTFPPLSEVIPVLRPLLGRFAPRKTGRRVLTPKYWNELRNRTWVKNKLEKLDESRGGPITAAGLAGRFGVRGGGGCQGFVKKMEGAGILSRDRTPHASGRLYQYSLTEKGNRLLQVVDYLDRLMVGDVAFARITSIENVDVNELPPFVYDLSVPDAENFVADTAICHNTRFDLIFVLRDTPVPGQDEKLATHILDVHRKRAYVESPPIQFELLKKYIAFAKNYSPVLTMEAENRIKEYYLQLRRSATEGQIGATPRTLESLIRLASAKARLMLRDQVTEDDALTAVALMNKMVEDVLTDTETKTKGDFGILLGQPAGERGKLATVMDTLRALEGPDRKPIEAKVFKQELMRTNKFANEDEVDNLIKKITKEGIIFESKPGFFRRVQG
jgi:DNA replicative helicase MCM subunit Mcm2 (Cdc46/Mcm family)/intein/homing endonuclease